MICATELGKTYEVKRRDHVFHAHKEKIQAVKSISMKIEKGDIVGLLGINGAGKTTTIKMLTTLLEPTTGSYTFDGIDALKHPKEVKQQINMIAGGERMIYWRLSAYENLWYYGQLYGIENEVLRKRIKVLLEMVGLSEKANLPVETFSKGMKQRLQIARGLINDPGYIFMDEPTIGLDAVVTAELHQEVKDLAKKQEKGILLTSHYLGEVEELCDYIYVLSEGNLLIEGTKKELTDYVFSRKQCVFSVQGMDENTRKKLHKELQVYDPEVEIALENQELLLTSKRELTGFLAEFSLREGYGIRKLYEKVPSLEDAVIKLSKEAAAS